MAISKPSTSRMWRGLLHYSGELVVAFSVTRNAVDGRDEVGPVRALDLTITNGLCQDPGKTVSSYTMIRETAE